jgi:hypothetical protein
MALGLLAPAREARYLDWLLQAATRMGQATQLQEVVAAVVDSAEVFLGPVGGMLVLLDASRRMLVPAAQEKVPPSVRFGYKSLPLTAQLPMAEAMNTARAIWISGPDERARRYPGLAARTPEPYACGSLPLADAGVLLGLLRLIRMGTGSAPPPFDEAERAVAGVLADLAGTAVGRLAGLREQDSYAGGQEAGVYEWDPVRDRFYCDAEMLRVHAHSPAAVRNSHVEAVPGGIPGFSVAHQLLARGDGQIVSYLCPVAGGQVRQLEARGYLIPDRTDREHRVVGVVTQARAPDGVRAGQLERHPASTAILGEMSAVLAAAATIDDIRQASMTVLQALGARGIMIAEQEAGRVRVVARAGAARAKTEQSASTPRAARMPAGEALSHGVPEYTRSTGDFLERYPHFRNALGGVDDHAWAILPLASEYDAPAACMLAFPPGWSPGGSEQARFLMASGLLAQALDRCRTHDQEHHLVTQMRDGPPAALPGLALACGYLPSTLGLGLGGDFCDAFLGPDGTPVLVIGDVQGHGSHAAAIADRLRTALRAYALEGHDPAETAARASRFMAHLNSGREDGLYATCCYLTLDPANGGARACSAGHPQPIMITDGEPARLLSIDAGLPLGVDPDHAYTARVFTLASASTLLLYTDGLVERPGADIAATTKEVLRELDDMRSADPAAILAALRPLNGLSPRYDDVAVLAARRTNHFPLERAGLRVGHPRREAGRRVRDDGEPGRGRPATGGASNRAASRASRCGPGDPGVPRRSAACTRCLKGPRTDCWSIWSSAVHITAAGSMSGRSSATGSASRKRRRSRIRCCWRCCSRRPALHQQVSGQPRVRLGVPLAAAGRRGVSGLGQVRLNPDCSFSTTYRQPVHPPPRTPPPRAGEAAGQSDSEVLADRRATRPRDTSPVVVSR